MKRETIMEKAFQEALEVLRKIMKNGTEQMRLEAATAILTTYVEWLQRPEDGEREDGDESWRA